jgi:HAD superfamily hydrolase (TIGR01509 family)
MSGPPRRLVVFDCDGVLVDSETLENAVMAECLTRAGLPMSGEEARARYIGLSMRAVMARVEAETGRPLPDPWLADFTARSHARLAEAVEATPGVVQALDVLEAAGWTCAVASSGGHGKMAVTLGRTGLSPRFAGRVFSADDVAAGKPAPDVYLLAARALGFAPTGAFAVEDSPNGARAALAAGMTTIGFARETAPEALRAVGVHAIIADMAELPALLARLSAG